MRFKKPIFILALATVLFNSATPQVFSQTQITSNESPPSQCFRQEDCGVGKYKNSFAVASSECSAYAPFNYNCISKPPTVKLSVPFGGNTEAYGITDYISIIYKFLIGSAGILAGIMIVIAGFEWLTAAGDSGKIKHARERITKALLGLVLVMGSYTILYTINPALVSLQLAPIKILREESLPASSGDGCKVGRDDALCSAKYPGAKCIAWQAASPDCTGWIIGATGGVAAAGGAACLAVPGAQALCLSALRAGGQFILKSGKFLLRTARNHPILAIGGGTIAAYQMGLIGSTTADEADGMCVQPDNQGNKRPGEECTRGSECASGQCSNLTLCSPIAGVCVDGKKGSPCRTGDNPPPEFRCNPGLTCSVIRTASGVSSYQFGSCSDGGWGSRCTNSGSACPGGDSWCSQAGWCIKSLSPPDQVEGTVCKTSGDCYGDQPSTARCAVERADGEVVYAETAILSGDQADLIGKCTTRTEGASCTQNVGRGGVSGCLSGNTCINFTNTAQQTVSRCSPTGFDSPCNTSEQCGSGLLCSTVQPSTTTINGETLQYNSVCLRTPGSSCTSDNACAGDASCINGTCLFPRGAGPCAFNSQCAPGTTCQNTVCQ